MNLMLKNYDAVALNRLRLLHLGHHPDVVLAIAVALVLGVMILPLPGPLLDIFLAMNFVGAAFILISVLVSERSLALSAFPSLLLLMTLYRLALNVATTRMILSDGQAGDIVRAFGQFVVRGDVVVGLVMFVVITLVQFLVIAKGSERVAEVGARFALDAMPGKQMSIDAALRSGSIPEDEAARRRDEVELESQYYGAMDGAMKFIRGDAIAGLIITALNLVVGLGLGVLRQDLPLAGAAEIYSVLTVGDGLVSQIPALFLTLAAGLTTTRVGSGRRRASLGDTLRLELTGRAKIMFLSAGLASALALVPGLPIVPFGVIAGALTLGGYLASERQKRTDKTKDDQELELKKKVQDASSQAALVDRLAPSVAPIAIDLDPLLSQRIREESESGDQSQDLVRTLIPNLRDALYLDSGVRLPGLRVQSDVQGLTPHSFVLRVRNVPIFQAQIPPGKVLAVDSKTAVQRLGVADAEPTAHPAHGGQAVFVPEVQARVLKAGGVVIWGPSGMIALYAARTLRPHLSSFVGLHETSEFLEKLEPIYPTLVKEVVPKVVTVSQLSEILRRLVDEEVSIRDLKTILECLANRGIDEQDSVRLTEAVREALSLQIAHHYSGMSKRLSVVLLDPVVEDTIRSAITHVTRGSYLALEADIRRSILDSVQEVIQPVAEAGVRPVILTNVEIRRYVRKLIDSEFFGVPVLSFEELPGDLAIQPVGRIDLEDLKAAA